MSNVLIGIIGVILFIGLALAGALFLGPRFRDSANNSKASAAVQAIAQTSNAFDMYRVNEGKPYEPNLVESDRNLLDDLVGTYLKARPVNPTSSDPDYAINGVDLSNAAPNGVGRRGAVLLYMPLAGNAEAICKAINKQTRGRDDVPELSITSAPSSGCMQSGGGYYAVGMVG